MKKGIVYILSILCFSAWSQTKVKKVSFNDFADFEGTELMLNGAGADEDTYALAIYLDFEVDGVQDGERVANKNTLMALTLKVMSTSFSKPELEEFLRNGLERATDGNSYLIEEEINKLIQLLPAKIRKNSILKFVYSKEKGVSLYDNVTLLGSVKSLTLKKALFRIWLGNNPINQELKEDLLGTLEVNLFFGTWKTFDLKTGVAISTVRLYMINNELHGVIERMLRLSERDAICYVCDGENKSKYLEGLVLLKNAKPKGKFKYVEGDFTNIRTGKVTDCKLWIEEDHPEVLYVKYKGGNGTEEWKRIEEKQKED